MQLDPELQAMLDERKRTMVQFTPNHRPMTIYAIYRNDIHMDKHKLGAQLGHAYDQAVVAAYERDPELLRSYKGTGHGKKTVMRAGDLNKLQRGWHEAKAAGLPCFVVIDRGHIYPPDFNGDPIITAIGIGPVYEDQAKDITKRFTMICEKLPEPVRADMTGAELMKKWEEDAARALSGIYTPAQSKTVLTWFRRMKGVDEEELIGKRAVQSMSTFVGAKDNFDVYSSLMARLFIYAPLILKEREAAVLGGASDSRALVE